MKQLLTATLLIPLLMGCVENNNEHEINETAYFDGQFEAYTTVIGSNPRLIENDGLNVSFRKELNQVGPVYQIIIKGNSRQQLENSTMVIQTNFMGGSIYNIDSKFSPYKYENSQSLMYETFSDEYTDNHAKIITELELECKCFLTYYEWLVNGSHSKDEIRNRVFPKDALTFKQMPLIK